MGQYLIRLLGTLVILTSLSSSVWAAAPAWQNLTPMQQNVLAPVKSKWTGMSVLQRTRLLAVAAKYPQLTPQQQRRFQKRLTTWSSLTKEQRELARENYKKLKRLPPRKQQAVKQKWLQSHPKIPAPVSGLPKSPVMPAKSVTPAKPVATPPKPAVAP